MLLNMMLVFGDFGGWCWLLMIMLDFDGLEGFAGF